MAILSQCSTGKACTEKEPPTPGRNRKTHVIYGRGIMKDEDPGLSFSAVKAPRLATSKSWMGWKLTSFRGPVGELRLRGKQSPQILGIRLTQRATATVRLPRAKRLAPPMSRNAIRGLWLISGCWVWTSLGGKAVRSPGLSGDCTPFWDSPSRTPTGSHNKEPKKTHFHPCCR